MCCDDLVAILRQALFLAARWGRKILVGALDVAIAFDSIDHSSLTEALLKQGVHPQLVLCLMRELSHMEASISLPGAGSMHRFALTKGGKQGGPMQGSWEE